MLKIPDQSLTRLLLHSASMASIIQKLARKSPSTAFINAFHKSPPLKPANHYIFKTQSDCHQTTVTKSNFCCFAKPNNLNRSEIPVIYPSFSIGFPLDPIFSTGFVPSEAEDAVFDDSRTVWADSVKKKRKKKMNKHKYRKLRKRMSRQN